MNKWRDQKRTVTIDELKAEMEKLNERVSKQQEIIDMLHSAAGFWEQYNRQSKVLKCKKLSPDAKLPTRGTPRSGGLDLYSTEDVEIRSFSIVGIKTQMAFEIPEGYCGLLMTRSNYGKNMVLLGAGANLIDEDYRGHLLVYLMNVGEYSWKIRKGDRIAQLAIVPCEYCEPVEVDELSETQRGTGGFGSTGR